MEHFQRILKTNKQTNNILKELSTHNSVSSKNILHEDEGERKLIYFIVASSIANGSSSDRWKMTPEGKLGHKKRRKNRNDIYMDKYNRLFSS